MFQKIIFWSVCFLASIVQITVFPIFFPTFSAPNLTLIILIFWTVKSGFSENFWRIIVAGLIIDLAYGFPVGLSILSFSLSNFAAASLSKRFVVSHKTWGFLAAFAIFSVSSLVNEMIFSFLQGIFFWRNGVNFKGEMVIFWLKGISGNIFFGLAFFAFAYWPMEKLYRFVSLYERDNFKKTRFLK